MKAVLSPEQGTIWPPWAAATDSRVRTEVEPTATTRPPAARVWRMRSAVAWEVGGGLGDVVALGVHAVVFDALGLDGAEGAGADVEGDEGAADAAGLEVGEEGVGEVEAGGGGGDGADLAGVDGLVAFAVEAGHLGVVGVAVDVGGDGGEAVTGEDVHEGCVGGEADAGAALVAAFEDVGEEVAFGEADGVADAGAAAAAAEGAPEADVAVGGFFLVAVGEEELGGAAGVGPGAEDACGEDAGVVEDEEVAGAEVVDDVGDVAVLDAVFGAVEDHHAGGAADGGRGLGDELLGEGVVEVCGEHGGWVRLVWRRRAWHR